MIAIELGKSQKPLLLVVVRCSKMKSLRQGSHHLATQNHYRLGKQGDQGRLDLGLRFKKPQA